MENKYHFIKHDKHNNYYQFNNFIEDESNSIAIALAKSIAIGNKQSYLDILIICGKTGTGKSHLAEAIINKLNSNSINNKGLFVRGETFVKNLSNAVMNNSYDDLVNFYLEYDILIIDDIQSLERKERSQEKLKEIITLYSIEKKTIVLTANAFPNELNGIEDGLLSRLTKSVVVSLHTHSNKAMIEILTNKSNEFNLRLPSNVIEQLVKNTNKSVRELEGNLITLLAKASVLGEPVTLDFYNKYFDK